MGEINRVSFCFLFTHVISPIIPVPRPFSHFTRAVHLVVILPPILTAWTSVAKEWRGVKEEGRRVWGERGPTSHPERIRDERSEGMSEWHEDGRKTRRGEGWSEECPGRFRVAKGPRSSSSLSPSLRRRLRSVSWRMWRGEHRTEEQTRRVRNGEGTVHESDEWRDWRENRGNHLRTVNAWSG